MGHPRARPVRAALRSLFRAVVFDGVQIVGFVPAAFSDAERTENGRRISPDALPLASRFFAPSLETVIARRAWISHRPVSQALRHPFVSFATFCRNGLPLLPAPQPLAQLFPHLGRRWLLRE